LPGSPTHHADVQNRAVLTGSEHVVLVHSPTSEKEYTQYPLLSDRPDAVCVYRDGHFIWRPEAMCGTHWYELIYRHKTRQLEAWSASSPPFYVWDHVAVVLHVGQNQVVSLFISTVWFCTFCSSH
ncbi:hypothetical protein ILYODFUR_038829, partial [Ilyodon furcidens]